jgi:arsenate reductase (thioredoxin)
MKTSLALLIFSLVSLQANSQQKQKVVFVCEHGAAKSVIAANYFNRLAKERGLNYVAVSRATVPDSTLNPATRAGLRADNIPQNRNPQKLALKDTVNARRIIMFTAVPGNFQTATPIEDWSGAQNIDGTYQQRRDAILKNIHALLDSLSKK